MWRSSKRLIIDCIQFVIRCGRSNFDADDLDDISDYDVLDVPSNVAIFTPAVARSICRGLQNASIVIANEKSRAINLGNDKNHRFILLSWLALGVLDGASQGGNDRYCRPGVALRQDTKCLNRRFNVLAVHFQPQTFGLPRQPRQDDLQHRPDAPGARRTSPPEVVSKVLQALEEMGEPVGPSAEKVLRASSRPLGYLLHLGTPSARTS
ncbi:PREDICTED: uncharacterized protein LOC105566430 [Vollenhovia emeryi]|uniref:uncharacterized protein LOC105566430 n=1 Tax=Vollenhovia emeryi TaxID=411798 RepID=UPI0005F3F114|nr:PREDICTED: uncharacterized protein LOC105566430 [Vollenhovia emeryi]